MYSYSYSDDVATEYQFLCDKTLNCHNSQIMVQKIHVEMDAFVCVYMYIVHVCMGVRVALNHMRTRACVLRNKNE